MSNEDYGMKLQPFCHLIDLKTLKEICMLIKNLCNFAQLKAFLLF